MTPTNSRRRCNCRASQAYEYTRRFLNDVLRQYDGVPRSALPPYASGLVDMADKIRQQMKHYRTRQRHVRRKTP